MENDRNAYERYVVKNVLSSTVFAGGLGDHYRQQNLRDELGGVGHEFAFDDGGLRHCEANSKDQREDDCPFNGYRKDHMPASSRNVKLLYLF